MNAFSEIQEAIAQNDLATARDLLRDALKNHPESAEVWFLAAQAAVNDAQREHFLEKAITLDPLHHHAANQLHDLRNPQPIHPEATVQPPQPTQDILAKVPTADFSQRTYAFVIDIAILLVSFIPVGAIVYALFPPGNTLNTQRNLALTMLLILTLQIVYHAYFFTQNAGQTPGKKWIGIQVVKCDGSNLTLLDAFLRSIIGYALSIVFFGAGFFWMLANDNARTWHDFVADTQVITTDQT